MKSEFPGLMLQGERRSESMTFRSDDAILTPLQKNQEDEGREGREGEKTSDFRWLISKYIFRLASLWQLIMLISHTVTDSFFRKSKKLEFTLQLPFKQTAVEGYIFKAVCGSYNKGKAGHDSSFHNWWCCSSFYSVLINSARNYFAICLL